jgi:hypothetical protein
LSGLKELNDPKVRIRVEKLGLWIFQSARYLPLDVGLFGKSNHLGISSRGSRGPRSSGVFTRIMRNREIFSETLPNADFLIADRIGKGLF